MAYFDCFIGDTGGGVALVITCASQFAGANITITDGVTTYVEQCPSTSPYEITIQGITPGTWTISGVYSGDTYTTIKTITNFEAELLTIPEGSTVTPTDDVQILLHCADIWDKSYTTIAEVIADTTSLLAIISDNNSVDYLVRSITWSSDICADQTAMAYIGANDYCADTLIEDSTWLNAICSSTYFESVLNDKVPTMTSNTTPSGVVSVYRTYAQNNAYKAFDGNDATWWEADINGSVTDAWIQYDFSAPFEIHKLLVRPYSTRAGYGQITKYTLLGSNDGGSIWNTVQTEDNLNWEPNQNDESAIINNVSYTSLRLMFNQTGEGNNFYPRIATVQFYGRA